MALKHAPTKITVMTYSPKRIIMGTNPDLKDSTNDNGNNIQFNDIFGLEEIQRLQGLFSDATGVASMITYPDGTPITVPSNFSRLCNDIIRKTEKGRANCYKSDAALGRHCPSGPIVQPCLSGGLWDAGTNITVEGKHIANWLIGQVRNEKLDEQRMLKYADEIGANREDFMDALNEVPAMSVEQFNNVAKMLFVFSNELSEKAYINLQLKKQIADREKAAALLQKSEESLSIMLHSIGDGVLSTDNNGLIVNMNPVAEHLCGWKLADAVGKPLTEVFNILNVETRKPVTNPVKKVLESGHIIGLANHTVLISKNGTEYQIADSAAPIKNIEGIISGVVLVFSDVTEKYKAEATLQNERLQLRTLIDNLPDSIYSKDLACRKTLANLTNVHLMGAKSEAEVLGKNDFDFYPKEIAEKFLADDQSVIQTGKPVLNREEYTFDEKGQKRWLLTSKLPLRDKDGRIIGLIGIGRNITSLKQAEERLREQADAMEASIDGMSIINADGNYIYINKSHAEIYGYDDANELIGGSWRVLYDTGELQRFDREIMPELSKNGHYQGRTLGKKKDGSTFPQSISLTILENGGIICIVRDITEHIQFENDLIKAKEKAEENDHLKSAFLANMSHEIRTPMNGILGFTGLLKEPDLTGENKQEYLRIIEQCGLRMLNILNDIVDLSKIESGQTKITVSETNINEQIEYIYNFFKPEVERKGMLLSFRNTLTSKESIIKTDREKVYAILTNLVKNAIKFTKSGFIEFGYEKKGEYLEFFVKDTGVGIRQEQKELIFERFRQGSELLTRNYEGAGLGLSISKAFVEMLGGRIWVESELGKGSTFYFTITCNAEPEEIIVTNGNV